MASTKHEGIEQVGPNRYRIRARATCPRTGQRREVDRVRPCSLKEARALQMHWLQEMTAELRTERAPRVRLKDFAASWLAGRKGQIKRGSAVYIATIWDVHIEGTKIAGLYVDDIRPEDVEEWLAGMRAKNYVPGSAMKRKRSTKSEPRAYKASTIRGAYAKLRQIIREASARARVPNPCDGVRGPKPNRSRNNFLRADEAGKVLAWILVHQPQWYPHVLISLTTGLRWSEVSALVWADLDEADGVIRVVRGQYKGLVSATTKNGESEDAPRVVPLLPEVAEVLRAHRQQMIRDQHPGLAEGWIFPARHGGLYARTPLSDVLTAACAAVGTKHRITGHGLRHTANDLLRRVASSSVTRSIIGHATEAMHQHYTHVDEGERRDAADRAFSGLLPAGGGIRGGTNGGGLVLIADSPADTRASATPPA